jgi:hypothetical protein
LSEIAADLASYGDDWTVIGVRWGPVVLHAEQHNGWLEDRVAGRLKQLAREWAQQATAARSLQAAPVRPEEIAVKYDGDGRGGSLITHAGGFRFIPICASSNALDPSLYPNRRSELWFTTAKLARQGKLSLTRLDRDTPSQAQPFSPGKGNRMDTAGVSRSP